jgi:hypothetical protein
MDADGAGFRNRNMTGGRHFIAVATAATVLGLIAGGPDGARAQNSNPFSDITGSIGSFFRGNAQATSPAVPGAPPSKDDWSGASGSSGHPLMQADAIRAAAANFQNCIAGYWPRVVASPARPSRPTRRG